ncbi:uncharacterized protein LOC141828867 [Curcuma longa]|uniref:uncharacterized protein LOC141817774 n=1 Tax=Curcuma longa TaxID=136217 RepID=UPI003D9F0944
MGHETTTAVNVGCKVLPICDAAATPVASKGGDSGGEKEVARTSERRRAVARVKQELLRWAAAAKSGKGGSKAWKVFYSRNKLKPEAESPECSAGKVSFKWDAGSCSGASSVCSPLSLPSASTSRNDHSHIHTINSASRLSFTCEKPRHGPTISSTSMAAAAGDEPVRNGQWITTDSEFVVLEL